MKVERKDGRKMRIEGGIEIEWDKGGLEGSMHRQKKTTFTKQNYIVVYTYKHMLTVVLNS